MSKPSPARVQILFEHFVGDLMGTRKDVVEPILVPAIEDQEFPEMLHDAAMLMTFFKSVLTLMTEVTVSDFTFNDINKPESERLRIVLSSVINFLRFRVGKMDFPDQVNLKSELVRESGDRLYMENQDLKMRIQNLQTQRRRDESAIEEARETNLKLAEELRAFDARQHGATEELNNIKLEKQKIISKMKEVQTHLECTQRECTRIQSYIVDSPEKLQQVIDDLGETLSKERDAVEAAVRQGRALMISADSFGVVEADVTVCIKSMEECDNVLMKLEECARKVQRQEEFLHAKEMEVKEANRTDNVSKARNILLFYSGSRLTLSPYLRE
jgi:kinetochore protein Nuf2